MAAIIISRRLRLTSTLLKSSSSFIFPPTFSQSKTPSSNSFPKFIPNSSISRPFFISINNSPPPPPSSNSDSDSKPQDPSPYPRQISKFMHLEIECHEVERDLSPLANETREVLEGMEKNMHKLSKILALLGLIQLGLGVFITEISVQSLLAFAFPLSVAFMLRCAVEPMYYLKKLEEHGLIQIQTVTWHVAKQLNVFFVGVRGISFASVAAISAGLLYTLFSRSLF